MSEYDVGTVGVKIEYRSVFYEDAVHVGTFMQCCIKIKISSDIPVVSIIHRDFCTLCIFSIKLHADYISVGEVKNLQFSFC